MAKVGKALRQALESHGISQTQLAKAMGIGLTTVNSWVTEYRAPSAEKIIEIRDALKSIEPSAAEEFIQLYLEG
jgi:transcriptional regulator with XRE-family HTH domain